MHHTAPSDFDEWESLGATGWNYAALKPYFKKSQSLTPSKAYPIPAHADRGTKGPVQIGYSWFNGLSDAFIAACGALGIPIRDDLNTDGENGARGTEGVSKTQTFIHKGGASLFRTLQGRLSYLFCAQSESPLPPRTSQRTSSPARTSPSPLEQPSVRSLAKRRLR